MLSSVFRKIYLIAVFCLAAQFAWAQQPARHNFGPVATDYPSLQAALDANRGKMVYLPPGNYRIDDKLHIVGDNSGLCGSGRIIQTNSGRPIVEIEHASGALLRDVTLTRADPNVYTTQEGIVLVDCRDTAVENVRVIDNRTRASAIAIRDCENCRVVGCLVRNYKCVTVEDRLTNPFAGYAFQCIDGSGIVVNGSQGTLIQGNRITEDRLQATRETMEKYGLGKLVKKAAQKPPRVPQQVWDSEYTDNWHQGSGLVVTSPEVTDRTQILDNTIEFAAQGIDLHSDHVIVSNNIVRDTHMGMKAMHGSRNVLIIGNQFIRNDLWSIGMMPGAASHGLEGDENAGAESTDLTRPSSRAQAEGSARSTLRLPNVDGGSIIANNIISDFGYGQTHWLWGKQRSPLKFDSGQLETNPPLTDVLVQGNLIYDSGRDKVLVDGQPQVAPPRYRYAVIVAQGPNTPRGLHFANNLFHPGTDGIANIELPE